MSNHHLIDIRHLHKNYIIGGVTNAALKDVSLQIRAGELVAIVGASGSGKSTLMNIIGLLDKADAGVYMLNQKAVHDLSADELASYRNQYIGFVFQQFNLLPRFTAEQNIALPLTYRRISPAGIDKAVMHALQQVGMTKFRHHRPTQLSGGQQQRIAIARALVTTPEVILADEPTGALDSKTGQEILELFFSLHQQGKTIIIVTHDERLAKLCQRRIIIVDGEIRGDNQ